MNDWKAQRTKNPQGADFREVALNGKISKLEFSLKPTSDFWRAGFKLFDPNGSLFPLRNSPSLLFHLGSTPSRNEYGLTAYRDGEWLKELNKTKTYPEDKLLTIRLEINHNNFLKVFVNNSLEFKPSWHLKNPDIREKVVIIAWGDENDYNVEFKDISFGNWKESKSTHTKNRRALHVTGNQNVFVDSHVSGFPIVSGDKNSLTKINKPNHGKSSGLSWGLIIAAATLVVGIIAIPWWPTWFRNDDNHNQKDYITPIPNSSIGADTPSPDLTESNQQNISKGDSYTDSQSKIVVGLVDVSVENRADISVTTPQSDTVNYENIVPGKVFYFLSNGKSYVLIVKTIDFVGSYIDITINPASN